MSLTSHCDISLFWQALPYTRHVSDAGLAKETDLYFMAVVERGTGKDNANTDDRICQY